MMLKYIIYMALNSVFDEYKAAYQQNCKHKCQNIEVFIDKILDLIAELPDQKCNEEKSSSAADN